MRRKARPAPFARRRLGSWLRDLAPSTLEEWPRHLQMARSILVDELKLEEVASLAILQSSLAAVHACAQRLDQSALDVFQRRHRDRFAKIFARMAKCAKRLPASPRHALDGEVRAHLRQTPIDSEHIATLIEALTMGFGKCPMAEPSLTVLRAVTPGPSSADTLEETDAAGIDRAFAEAAITLQDNYAALPALDQRNVESALTSLVEKRSETLDTADVCTTLSDAVPLNTRDKISPAAAGLITDYVTDVAMTWRQHGLWPSRARNPLDAAYHSRFHRFADLVLTAVVDPKSNRHDGDQVERLATLRKAHAALPEDIRGSVRAGLPRADAEWLVSEDHLRRALKRLQKTSPQTP